MLTTERENELNVLAESNGAIKELLVEIENYKQTLDFVNMTLKNGLDRVGSIMPNIKLLVVLAMMQDKEIPELRPYLDASIDRLGAKYGFVKPTEEDEEELDQQLAALGGKF